MIQIGDKVPDFLLGGVDMNNQIRGISLAEFEGKNVILYFYPKNETQYCTIEACKFRDKLNKVNKAVVIGVSSDSVDSHGLFKSQHNLNFILLSDPDHKLGDLFDAWDEEMQMMKRQTFLINGDGIVLKEWRDVDVADHADEVFDEL